MRRVPLQSRLLESAAYNPDTRVLHVWLRSGRHLSHPGISPEVYAILLGAASPGFYYSYYIVSKVERAPKQAKWAYKLAAAIAGTVLILLPG